MFYSNEFFSNPYRIYADLRSRGPLVWDSQLYGGAWLVTQYETVTRLLKHPALSARRAHVIVAQLPEEQRPALSRFTQVFERWLMNLDPPDHTRLRKPLNKLFSPTALRNLTDRIQSTVDRLLDQWKGDEVDFMSAFGHQLPLAVIAEVMGFEPGTGETFIKWTDDIGAFLGRQATPENGHKAQNSLLGIEDFFQEGLMNEQHQRSSLIRVLRELEASGEIANHKELLAQCSMILFTGHEPTRNMLGNGLYTLLKNPKELEKLRKNPQLAELAVQEIVRYESPVQLMGRLVTENFCTDGVELKQGQLVLFMGGCANRDPARFKNPDAFDIGRDSGPNLGYGGVGPHVCLGATLATLQGAIAFRTLSQRFPKLRLSEEPSWDQNPLLRGVPTLKVRVS